jgi:hypothetical protein
MPTENGLDVETVDYGELDSTSTAVEGQGTTTASTASTCSGGRITFADALSVQSDSGAGVATTISSRRDEALGVGQAASGSTVEAERTEFNDGLRTPPVISYPSVETDGKQIIDDGVGTTHTMSTSSPGTTTSVVASAQGSGLYTESSSNEREETFQDDSIPGTAQNNDPIMADVPFPTPRNDVLVDREPYRYNAKEYDDGTESEQTVYRLRKAPVKSVQSVRAEVDGDEILLVEGEDYEVADQDRDMKPDSIDFGADTVEDGLVPDFGSTFYVSYRCRPVVERYTESFDETYEQFLPDVNYIVNSAQITNAQDDDLNRIGREFGPLGKRQDRNNPEYQTYLQSLVRAFKGRGTVEGVRFAIASATIGGKENVGLDEDFVESVYKIVLRNWTPHRTETISELAELADPSGVERIPPIQYRNPGTNVRLFSDVTRATEITITLETDTVIMDAGDTTTERYADGLGSGYLGEGDLSREEDLSTLQFDNDTMDDERLS